MSSCCSLVIWIFDRIELKPGIGIRGSMSIHRANIISELIHIDFLFKCILYQIIFSFSIAFKDYLFILAFFFFFFFKHITCSFDKRETEKKGENKMNKERGREKKS
jgi:hypothetical protein